MKRRHYQAIQALISKATSKYKPCLFTLQMTYHATFRHPFDCHILSCAQLWMQFLLSPFSSRPSRYLCLPLLTCTCNNHCLAFFFSLSTSPSSTKSQLSSRFSKKLTSHKIVRSWELQRTRFCHTEQ